MIGQVWEIWDGVHFDHLMPEEKHWITLLILSEPTNATPDATVKVLVLSVTNPHNDYNDEGCVQGWYADWFRKPHPQANRIF